jgi:hypothetical protein
MIRHKRLKYEGLPSDFSVSESLGYSDHFTITITPSEGATGVIKFSAKTDIDSDVEVIMDVVTSLAKEIDLSSGTQSFIISGYFLTQINTIVTSLVGTYTLIIQQASK